jgi:HD-GYP domain-containing protein (c-di-GMP phosphodiesterase class II)
MAAFANSAEEEIARAARFSRPLALLVIEILPELAPDRGAIQQFALQLRQHTRGFDLIGRADDGAFLVLLPEAGPAEAEIVVKRILIEACECLGTATQGTRSVNPVRIGAAAFPNDGMLLRELEAHAWAALAQQPPQLAPVLPASEETGERLDDRRVHAFVATLAIIGVGLLLASLAVITPEQALRLLPLLILVVAAERLTNLDFGDKVTLSLATIITMAAAALGGPATGAVVGFVSALAMWQFNRLPLIKGAFNVGNLTISGAMAGVPFFLTGGMPALGTLPTVLLPGVAAGLLYVICNSILIAMVIGLTAGTSWWREWRLRFTWTLGHYAVFGAISLGLAALYQSYSLTGLLLMLGPAGLLYYAQRQYINHTTAHVSELSQLNQDLTGSNERLLDMNERLEGTLEDLRQANDSLLRALSEALELRDQETEGHSQRVVRYAHATAQALGLPDEQIEAVVHGALLHDLGKIGVSDAILKKPGPLTPSEWQEMRRHPEIGYRIIASIPFLKPAAELVLHHHEHWNGRGYPHGLAGPSIPLGARIFAVVDAFDAMTSNRPYRAALSWETAIDELERGSGTQFDPLVVTTFINLITSGMIQPPKPESAESALAGEETTADRLLAQVLLKRAVAY